MINQQPAGQSQSDPQPLASTLEPFRTGLEAIAPKGIQPITAVEVTGLILAFNDAPHHQIILTSTNPLARIPAAQLLLNNIPPGCILVELILKFWFAVAPHTSYLHVHPPKIPKLDNDPHAPELSAWLRKSGFLVQKLARTTVLILFAIITASSSVLDDADAPDDDDDDAEECCVPHHHGRRPPLHASRFTFHVSPLRSPKSETVLLAA